MSRTSTSEGPGRAGVVHCWPGRVRYTACAVMAGIVVVLDQATKLIASQSLELHEVTASGLPVLEWHLVRNEGAAFGIPGLFTGMFVVITIVVVALVVRALPRTERLSMALAYGLVVGGALGNVTDRLFREGAPDGKVVDFIKIGWWPTFNLADTAIVIGAGLIVWLLLRAEREERRREAASGAAAEPLPSPPGWGEKARPDGDGSGAVRAEDGRADGAEASAGAGERVGRSGPSAQGR